MTCYVPKCINWRHRKSFWICALFALLVELVNGFLHGGDQVETMTLLMEIIGLLTCALFAGSFVCTDFVNRTIYHALTAVKAGDAFGSANIWPMV